jgi:hypothetical protein
MMPTQVTLVKSMWMLGMLQSLKAMAQYMSQGTFTVVLTIHQIIDIALFSGWIMS